MQNTPQQNWVYTKDSPILWNITHYIKRLKEKITWLSSLKHEKSFNKIQHLSIMINTLNKNQLVLIWHDERKRKKKTIQLTSKTLKPFLSKTEMTRIRKCCQLDEYKINIMSGSHNMLVNITQEKILSTMAKITTKVEYTERNN